MAERAFRAPLPTPIQDTYGRRGRRCRERDRRGLCCPVRRHTEDVKGRGAMHRSGDKQRDEAALSEQPHPPIFWLCSPVKSTGTHSVARRFVSRTSLFWTRRTVPSSDTWPAKHTPSYEQSEHQQHEEYEQKDPGDEGEVARQTPEAENSGDQGQDREQKCPAQHGSSSFASKERSAQSGNSTRGHEPDESARPQCQSDDNAKHQPHAEGRSHGLRGIVSNDLFDLVVAFAGLFGDAAVSIAEPVGRVFHGLGRGGERRRASRSQVAQKTLDRLAPLAGFLLDEPDELVNVSRMNLEIIIGQLTPPLLHLSADLIPLTAQHLSIDGRHDEAPCSHFLQTPTSGRPLVTPRATYVPSK